MQNELYHTFNNPQYFVVLQDNSNSSVIAGQCECKANTVGRQCDKCKDGFYDLKGSHVTGCISCGCVLDGTKNRNSSCHATTGQCDCKDRVTGTKKLSMFHFLTFLEFCIQDVSFSRQYDKIISRL